MIKNKILVYVVISCAIGIIAHLLPYLLFQAWNNDAKQAYALYQKKQYQQAEQIRTTWLSWNYQYLFNLWTMLAETSVVSWQVTDRNTLQQAEQYLSWAADIVPQHTEIQHNLSVVRTLLAQSWTWSESPQQQDQQTNTWDQQQEQQQQQWSWSSWQEQQQWSTPLSQELKQQIEQYQQQLQQEQQANQQYFWKQRREESMNFLDQLFWWTPQLQQQIDSWEEQDW